MPGDSRSSFVEYIAGYTGDDASARIIITLLASIPLAFLYRLFMRKLQPKYKNLFFIVTGALLYYFNFGFYVVHQIIEVSLTYLLFKLFLPTWQRKTLVAINMTMSMLYMGVCYYFYETEEYDINFTIPHCLLVLRMIALGFDILDGVKPCGPLSKEQSEAALSEVPPLLNLYGFVFMTPAFLVGPVFGYKQYQRFITGEFDDKPGFWIPAKNSFFYGCIYLVLRQLGNMLVPMIFFLTPCLKCSSLMKKGIYVSLLGKIFLWKYAGVYLLSESALITFGVGYGQTEEGIVSDWAGCRNVNIRLLDLEGVRLNHYIQGMNIVTNKWTANYIYKRLKFMGSRFLSFAITCIFLAVWHGHHSGYYVTFALEFFVINFEKEFEHAFNQVESSRFSRVFKILEPFTYLFLRIYNVLMFGMCVIPFEYLNFEDWSSVYCNIYDLVKFVAFMYGLAFGILVLMKILKKFT